MWLWVALLVFGIVVVFHLYLGFCFVVNLGSRCFIFGFCDYDQVADIMETTKGM